ncbi:hypothetical protein KVT40_007308 [Elsinoe batatas]|uniref:Uncharacterized protein n=1 Tax=Elsinoe batatas TaxID=2601811 RepID=A0A8K0PC73_9PEZI|nr:hypothetical protein KVT40_007308 [Elsinoe batatas]
MRTSIHARGRTSGENDIQTHRGLKHLALHNSYQDVKHLVTLKERNINLYIKTTTMPSPMSGSIEGLCKHTEYMVGCVACYMVDLKKDNQEAGSRIQGLEKDLKATKDQLRDQNMRPEDRERFEEKCKQLQQQFEDWTARQKGIRTLVTKAYDECAVFCKSEDHAFAAKLLLIQIDNPPEGLADAFTTAAHFHAHDLEQIWRAGQPEDVGVRFQPETRAPGVFTGLDRSCIPSTPDSLVRDPAGFQLLLQAARLRKKFPPTKGLGPEGGPAIMAFGSALAKFGPLYESSDGNENDQEADGGSSLEKDLGGCKIDDRPEMFATEAEPRTERDFLLRYTSEYSTEGRLQDGQRWALLAPSAHMADVELLAGQYCKLVADKKARLAEERADKKGKKISKALGAAVVPTDPDPAPSTPNALPDVEELNWPGFTNWLHACEESDPGFRLNTVPEWQRQRRAFADEIGQKVTGWFSKENALACFERVPNTPRPGQFIKPDLDIAALDSRRLGLTGGKSSKPPSQQPPPAQPQQGQPSQGGSSQAQTAPALATQKTAAQTLEGPATPHLAGPSQPAQVQRQQGSQQQAQRPPVRQQQAQQARGQQPRGHQPQAPRAQQPQAQQPQAQQPRGQQPHGQQAQGLRSQAPRPQGQQHQGGQQPGRPTPFVPPHLRKR